MRDLFVVVSGAPGSGKSTLAKPLSEALGLPLIEKDVIKEALGDVFGAADLDESKQLGAATMEVLYALAGANTAAVLESAWIPDLARPRLEALGRPIVEVLCDAPVSEAMRRYAARAGTRHAVHSDHARADEEAFRLRAAPIGGAWPLIRVDTTKPVDLSALVAEIDAAY